MKNKGEIDLNILRFIEINTSYMSRFNDYNLDAGSYCIGHNDIYIDLDQPGHNDEADAFRHAYVHAQFAYNDGTLTSRFLGNYHEISTPANDGHSVEDERRMDLYNNEIGRRIGENLRNDPNFQNKSEEEIKAELLSRIHEALTNGDLITTIDPNDPRDGNRSLSDLFPISPPSAPIPGHGLFSGILPSFEGCFSTGEQTFTRIDPIILDLDGDGIETTSLENNVNFDLDANGFAESTAWVNWDDGLLVSDRNSNGYIDSGRELFGDQTLLNNGQLATSGYQALAELDSNLDGKIDLNDTQFADLKVK